MEGKPYHSGKEAESDGPRIGLSRMLDLVNVQSTGLHPSGDIWLYLKVRGFSFVETGSNVLIRLPVKMWWHWKLPTKVDPTAETNVPWRCRKPTLMVMSGRGETSRGKKVESSRVDSVFFRNSRVRVESES